MSMAGISFLPQASLQWARIDYANWELAGSSLTGISDFAFTRYTVTGRLNKGTPYMYSIPFIPLTAYYDHRRLSSSSELSASCVCDILQLASSFVAQIGRTSLNVWHGRSIDTALDICPLFRARLRMPALICERRNRRRVFIS
jgi:hypothetical protein